MNKRSELGLAEDEPSSYSPLTETMLEQLIAQARLRGTVRRECRVLGAWAPSTLSHDRSIRIAAHCGEVYIFPAEGL